MAKGGKRKQRRARRPKDRCPECGARLLDGEERCARCRTREMQKAEERTLAALRNSSRQLQGGRVSEHEGSAIQLHWQVGTDRSPQLYVGSACTGCLGMYFRRTLGLGKTMEDSFEDVQLKQAATLLDESTGEERQIELPFSALSVPITPEIQEKITALEAAVARELKR